MASLNGCKVACESVIKSGNKAEIDRSERWTASNGRALEEEVEKDKRGLLFSGIASTRSPFGMAYINTRHGFSGVNSLNLIHPLLDRHHMQTGAY
jgi:hypothetical protein